MFLFEDTLLAATVGFVTVSALLVRRLVTGEPAQTSPVCMTTAAALGLVLANWAIVTPRERIVLCSRELARLVDEGNISEIGQRLAPDFSASGLDKEEFLKRAAAALTRVRLDQVQLRNVEVTQESEDTAIAMCNAYSNIRTADGFAAALPSRWRLRFTRRGENWLLTEAESIPVPPLHIKDPFHGLPRRH